MLLSIPGPLGSGFIDRTAALVTFKLPFWMFSLLNLVVVLFYQA